MNFELNGIEFWIERNRILNWTELNFLIELDTKRRRGGGFQPVTIPNYICMTAWIDPLVSRGAQEGGGGDEGGFQKIKIDTRSSRFNETSVPWRIWSKVTQIWTVSFTLCYH